MKHKLMLICIGLIGLCSFSSFKQSDDPIAALLKKLDEYTKKYPQEKVHLHLDKPYYAVGDNIWFKAYLTDSRTSKLSTLSGILYVELIDEQQKITKQLKLPLISGITWGDFKLTDTLREGNYRIRAYTQLMRNVGPEFFFDKTIKIGNLWSNGVITRLTNTFSEENAVEKVNSTIGFFNKTNMPYVGHEVSYEVWLDSKKNTTGKLITNNKGEIDIPIVNTETQGSQSGKIIATITLADQQKITKTITLKNTSNVTDVQFFAEGGQLVEDLPNRLAVKAVNSNGTGEKVSGQIIDQEGNEVSQFETSQLGMGSTFFTPLAGKTYSAKVKLQTGKTLELKLPQVEKSGYVLTINNTYNTKISIRVGISTDLLNKGELKLVGQRNGEPFVASFIQTDKQFTSVVVDKKDFTSGIVQFTLFNADNTPVCERLAFVNNVSDKIDLTLSELKGVYGKRENVNLELIAKNNENFVKGAFSLAVTNTTVVKPDPENESNILTQLLLTSDLVGFVEKPNSYFLNNDAESRIALDNLLLTQGWRKLNWKAVLNEVPPTQMFEAEKEMKISGRLKTPTGKPVVKGKVTLFSNTNGLFTADALTNDKGHFDFGPISFNDQVTFRIQGKTEKGKGYNEIEIDQIPKQLVTPNKNKADVEVNVNESLSGYLNQSNAYFNELVKSGRLEKVITLKEIEVTTKAPVLTSSSNWNGPGKADFVVTSKDIGNPAKITSYLKGSIPGVAMIKNIPYLERALAISINPQPMAIYLDGVEIRPADLDQEVLASNVESIEVLKSSEYTKWYAGAPGGVLVITSKPHALNRDYASFAAGIMTYIPTGYYTAREFYSPKYEANSEPKPDFRTTVYWHPNLISDENGKANFNYFNTDQAGNYRIVIEGMDNLGNLARKVYTYEVK